MMMLGKISVVAALAVAATGLMAPTALAQSNSKSSTTSNLEAPPFDPKRWETSYWNGRKYYRCTQQPGCSTLASYALEKIDGDLDPAFEKEIENQRAISKIPKRQLLSFDTKKRANDPGITSASNWRNRATLSMSWRDGTENTANVRFGSLRIVYEHNTRILVLVTSSNLAAARTIEIAVSRSLSVFP
jgi:hypothetical protein